ncbi:MAG: dethiobiotin synthase [Myxococcota bacterium]|nr:dethiobiotin synthase [Myxococcota bacterium]
MSRGFFVTGTDTGVGKTVAACALVRGLREEGIDVGAMKPMETGVDPEAGPLDAAALAAAAGHVDPPELVCPVRFELPAAPNVAAANEGKQVDLEPVYHAFKELASRHDWMVVEGAGGLLVPTTDSATMADLAATLSLPIVVVARPALGTINHTRLTVEEANRRGLELLGVVISHDQILSDADTSNLGCLREWLGDRLLAEIPLQEDTQKARIEPAAIAQLIKRVG